MAIDKREEELKGEEKRIITPMGRILVPS